MDPRSRSEPPVLEGHAPLRWHIGPYQRDHGASIVIVDSDSRVLALIPPVNPLHSGLDIDTAKREPDDLANVRHIKVACNNYEEAMEVLREVGRHSVDLHSSHLRRRVYDAIKRHDDERAEADRQLEVFLPEPEKAGRSEE